MLTYHNQYNKIVKVKKTRSLSPLYALRYGLMVTLIMLLLLIGIDDKSPVTIEWLQTSPILTIRYVRSTGDLYFPFF